METGHSLEEEILIAVKKSEPRGFLTQSEHRVFSNTHGKERMLIAIKGLIEDGLINPCLINFGLSGLTVVTNKMTLTRRGGVAANQLIADAES